MAAAARRRTAIASKRSMADDEARTAIAVAKRGTGVLRARVDIPLIKMPTPVKRIVAAVERRQAAVARRPCCRAVTDEAARISTAVATSGATARIDILGRRDVSGRPNKTCHLQHLSSTPFRPSRKFAPATDNHCRWNTPVSSTMGAVTTELMRWVWAAAPQPLSWALIARPSAGLLQDDAAFVPLGFRWSGCSTLQRCAY